MHPEVSLLSPSRFALLCQANPDAVLDLYASGQLIEMEAALGA